MQFPAALLLLFIGLRLGHVIEWSWLWILSPFWIPFAVAAVAFLVYFILLLFESDEAAKRRELRDNLTAMSKALRGRK